jgi:hypothetical protein
MVLDPAWKLKLMKRFPAIATPAPINKFVSDVLLDFECTELALVSRVEFILDVHYSPRIQNSNLVVENSIPRCQFLFRRRYALMFKHSNHSLEPAVLPASLVPYPQGFSWDVKPKMRV